VDQIFCGIADFCGCILSIQTPLLKKNYIVFAMTVIRSDLGLYEIIEMSPFFFIFENFMKI